MMNRRKLVGFVLLEVVIYIGIIGILLLTILPLTSKISDEKRFRVTIEKMENIRKAIIGELNIIEKDRRIEGGYFSDTGQLPASLSDLVSDPGIVGWNGPYIEDKPGYDKDAWGNKFIYNASNGTITSYGSDNSPGGTGYGQDITMYIYQPLINLSSNSINVYVMDGKGNFLNDNHVGVYIKYPYSSWNSLSYNNGYFYLSNVPSGTKHKIRVIPLPSYSPELGEEVGEYIVVYPKGSDIQSFFLNLKGSLNQSFW